MQHPWFQEGLVANASKVNKMLARDAKQFGLNQAEVDAIRSVIAQAQTLPRSANEPSHLEHQFSRGCDDGTLFSQTY
jgi:hypothetical protein